MKKNLLKKERNVMARSASVLRMFFPVVDCRERGVKRSLIAAHCIVEKDGDHMPCPQVVQKTS